MQKIKNISIIFLIFLLCLSNFFVISLASSVEVTKENLEQAFDDLMASNVLESAPDITFSDEYITISSEGESYQLNYDISGNPVFSIELPVQQGMSYEEFNTVSSNDMYVLNINGILHENINTITNTSNVFVIIGVFFINLIIAYISPTIANIQFIISILFSIGNPTSIVDNINTNITIPNKIFSCFFIFFFFLTIIVL